MISRLEVPVRAPPRLFRGLCLPLALTLLCLSSGVVRAAVRCFSDCISFRDTACFCGQSLAARPSSVMCLLEIVVVAGPACCIGCVCHHLVLAVLVDGRKGLLLFSDILWLYLRDDKSDCWLSSSITWESGQKLHGHSNSGARWQLHYWPPPCALCWVRPSCRNPIVLELLFLQGTVCRIDVSPPNLPPRVALPVYRICRCLSFGPVDCLKFFPLGHLTRCRWSHNCPCSVVHLDARLAHLGLHALIVAGADGSICDAGSGYTDDVCLKCIYAHHLEFAEGYRSLGFFVLVARRCDVLPGSPVGSSKRNQNLLLDEYCNLMHHFTNPFRASRQVGLVSLPLGTNA